MDRRIKERHQARHLQVTARVITWFGVRKAPVEVECVDFNRYGMAIETPHAFRRGDRIEFSFRGRYISEQGILGTVVSRAPSRNGNRYGILFAYCQSPRYYTRETDNALARIERLCSELGIASDSAEAG
ncbi:PilZ domain-containing protein [Hahella sp. SMD15-11]|uniref:PilZ domain-containing protein n=1 Tax=Thermohahella caldifontis TaxID=3142973 RepID=A0AB39V055_9GAMM